MKKLLFCALLACLPSVAFSQATTLIQATKIVSNTGAPLASGQWCLGSTCFAVTNGVIASGSTVTNPTNGKVTITNGSGTTYLTVPNVTASGFSFSWDGYVVPSTGVITGIGPPRIACSVGSQYTQTDGTQSVWSGTSTNGACTWNGMTFSAPLVGPPGPAPNISIGTVTVNSGAFASATLTGDPLFPYLNFGLPLAPTATDSTKLPLTTAVSLAEASYSFWVNAGVTYARNNSVPNIQFSNTDAAVVINQALAQMTTTGGTLYFANGVYNLNSATQETVSPYTGLWCAVCIQSTNATNYPSFRFKGESAGIGSQVHPAKQGVIFNVTAAAETAAGSGTLAAFWMRPNTTCDTEYPAYPGACLYWNDHVFFDNLVVNFPSNIRGDEYAIDMLEASYLNLTHVQAGFTTATNTPATSSNLTAFKTPAVASDGVLIQETQVDPGWHIAYEVNTEHSVLINTETFEDTYCYVIGGQQSRNRSAIYHSNEWTHIQVYDCIYGITAGSYINAGAQLDIIGLDVQRGTTGPWAQQCLFSAGPYLAGLITWNDVLDNGQDGGMTDPFCSGGSAYVNIKDGALSTGHNANATATDVQITRPGESDVAQGMPWLQMNGPNGSNALAEYASQFQFWFCPGAGCTSSWQYGTAISQSGVHTNGLMIGSGGTTTSQEQSFAMSGCTASANSSCTIPVTLPHAMPDTSWNISCYAMQATGAGYVWGGSPVLSTSTTVVVFQNQTGSSNTLAALNCRAWE